MMKLRSNALLGLFLVCTMVLAACGGGGDTPADAGTSPTDLVETDEGTEPTDEGTEPTDEGTEPTDEGTEPTDEGTEPTDEGTAPVDEGTAPVDEGTAPVDEGTAPVDEGTAPVDEGTAPVDEGTAPVDEGTEPVDEGTEPVDEGATDDIIIEPVGGNTCDTAIEITTFPYDYMTGNTSVLTQNYDSSLCDTGALVGSASPDQVFRIIANQHAIYRITVIPAISYDPKVYVSDVCPDVAEAACLAHADNGNAGGAEVVEIELQPSGEAMIIVDGWSNTNPEAGAFEMHITLHEAVCNDGFDNDGDGFSDCADPDCDDSDQCTELDCTDGIDNDGDSAVDCGDIDCVEDTACLVQGGDSCSDPIVLSDFPINADTSVNTDQHTSAGCPGSIIGGGYPDQVFQYTAGAAGRYTFELSKPDGINTSYDPDLYVSSACPLSAESCVGSSDAFGTDTVEMLMAFGDTAYIFVDATFGLPGGIFSLNMDYEPAELNCQDGIDDDGDTLVDCDDSDCVDHPDCAPPGADCSDPIIVTSFPVNGTTIGMDSDNNSVTSCTGAGMSLGPDLVYGFQAPSLGRYTFSISSMSGWYDTVLYASTSCPVQPLSLEEECSGEKSCTAADDLNPGEMESLEVELDSGEWVYIHVDGFDFVHAGPFTLDMTMEDIETNCTDGLDNDGDTLADCSDPDCGDEVACVGEGDKCGNAIEIDTTDLPGTVVSVSGDTSMVGIFHDYQGQCCQGGLGPNTAPDTVYKFTAPVSGNYKFRLDGDLTTFDTIFYGNSTCPPVQALCQGGNDAVGNGGEEFSVALAADSELYIYVDGWGAYSGAFTMHIETYENVCNDGIDNDGDGKTDCGGADGGISEGFHPDFGDPDCIADPFCVMSGDVCFDPMTIDAVPTVGNPVVITGDTSGFNSNYEPCNSAVPAVEGKDVVYSFQAPANGTYKFSLTADVTVFDSVLYLSDSTNCPPSPEGCAGGDSVEGFGGESVEKPMSAGQQTLIYVDGAGIDKMGSYELKIERLN